MLILTKKTKTFWQKIYSFLGFWTYTTETRKIIYWCMFPSFCKLPFYRKFDIFSWKK